MVYDEAFQKEEVKRFFSDGGDRLRLNYDLNEESVVFDLGGYKGHFAALIYHLYKSKIYVFEPSISFHQQMEWKFGKNFNIKLFNYGLSDKNENLQLVKEDDASYIAKYRTNISSTDLELIKVKSFAETYKNLGIDKIDLLKINVEGAEYKIMENIFENDLQSNIKIFQVQFHHISNECDANLISIRNKLSKTHTQKWNYEWVWESWEIN